jgi:hypothetical protein
MAFENYSGTEDSMNKTKVVVFIDGGRVDNVLSNWPVKIVIVDYDLEGLDDDNIRKVIGEEMYVYSCFETSEVNAEVVRQVFKDIGR